MLSLPRPDPCRGCVLDDKASGFALPEGPISSPLLWLGEALGGTEAATGRNFVGDAGGMLQRVLNLLGWQREAQRIGNTIACFPGDTLIQASEIQRGYRRWYEGVLVTVKTAEGSLTGTPNHPVLTPKGWMALGELVQGDSLINGVLSEGMLGCNPDIDERPARFADLFDALTHLGRRGRVIGADVDFHGDGGESEIDIVTTDRLLWHGVTATRTQQSTYTALITADRMAQALTRQSVSYRTAVGLPPRHLAPDVRLVGSRREGRTPLRIEARPANKHGVMSSTDRYLDIAEVLTESRLPNPVLHRERLQTFPLPIAPSEILEIDRAWFSGHVFNLQTAKEEYLANGFIVHNCRPPNDWMDGSPQAPWFYGAIDHCTVHRDKLLAEPHRVIVALGGTALKVSAGLLGQKKIRVNDFHGSVLSHNGKLIVPTFHPAFLQRGAHNLIGTVLWDLQQAEKASREGQPKSDHTLIIDPPLDWFTAWVDQVVAARISDPWAFPISSDIETPDKAGGKDEGEITAEDRSFIILRVNVSCHPDEGVTVPFIGGYIDQLIRLHQSPGPIWGWNYIGYDFERTVASGLLKQEDFPKVIDLMWLWHKLQSDLPRGLGFVAPFYSAHGPWKHIADTEAAKYAAIDALQNHRIGFGVIGDLQKTGMYDSAMRYVHQLMYQALRPAQIIGVGIDRPALLAFKADLGQKATRLLDQISGCVPDELLPLTPKQGLTKRPLENVLHVKATAFTRKGTKRAGKEGSEIKYDLYKKAVVVEREVTRDVFVCGTCCVREVQRRHRCADRGLQSDVRLDHLSVTRWFWQEPFNPDSPDQVLAYIKFRKHPVGRAKKTQKDSTNKETLKKLTRTGDPFYSLLLDYRAVVKVKGTYVDGTERRMDKQDRIHPEYTFKPSTGRLSAQNPNITNVISDRGGAETLAAGFRKCVVAVHTSRLLEVDFGGSEAVDFGWWCRDPQYIKLAKLGVHSGLASHILGRPYDPTWSDDELGAYFKAIKKAHDQLTQDAYNTSKRFVHAFSFGMTIPGMVLQFPEVFKTQKIAEHYADVFTTMAPKAVPFQRSVRELAFKQHYLGGPSVHPFGDKHWFWSVFTYKKITSAQYWRIIAISRRKGWDDSTAPVANFNGQYFRINLGEDSKRCVAFLPQSTTAGKLKEVMLRLFDPISPSYLGTIADGLTPLRAPIHDSLLLEIPTRLFELVAETVFREMQRPFKEMPMPEDWGLGPFLATGVSAKTGIPGGSWASMEDLSVPGFAELGVGSDRFVSAPNEDETDDAEDFAREIA